MHHLDRKTVPTPSCLADGSSRRYPSLTSAEKEEIRTRLLELQKYRCAYCERRTGHERDDGHIEHFRKQADHPELDMAWANLFWSCSDEKTCGKYKDKCIKHGGPLARFAVDELIDPGEEDPTRFLLFVTDGTVRPKDGIDPACQRRAETTIRVLHLSGSAYLRKLREDAIRPYLGAIESLASHGRAIVKDYLRSQMAYVEGVPFATAIRQYMEGFLS